MLPRAASPRKNKDSVDFVVIDDPESDNRDQIKITIENKLYSDQRISIENNGRQKVIN